MKSDPDNLVACVGKVVEWLLKQRWKKIAWASVSSLKFAAKIRARAGAAAVTQKVIRMYLARSVHKPRYIGIRELGTLRSQIPTMQNICAKLKSKDKIQKVIKCSH
jgi:myosin-6